MKTVRARARSARTIFTFLVRHTRIMRSGCHDLHELGLALGNHLLGLGLGDVDHLVLLLGALHHLLLGREGLARHAHGAHALLLGHHLLHLIDCERVMSTGNQRSRGRGKGDAWYEGLIWRGLRPGTTNPNKSCRDGSGCPRKTLGRKLQKQGTDNVCTCWGERSTIWYCCPFCT